MITNQLRVALQRLALGGFPFFKRDFVERLLLSTLPLCISFSRWQ
ncbi:hypothetical protein HMPREF1869_00760 [Bacteroidales bacterium KA00251]|nr:hypothetical protein HMPREF1869_00760 [Bacteroidales bacterium KA00251]